MKISVKTYSKTYNNVRGVLKNFVTLQLIDKQLLLFFLIDENGYPPERNDEVFDQVLDQVENYKTYN